MYQHRYFNLRLHENIELEAILQNKIVERKTLHEWPLSCVEQLFTSNGDTWVYKSQFGPTVESEFYANARSRLLPAGETLYRSETGHSNMLFEFIEAPLIEDLNLSDDALLSTAYGLIEEIATIEGDLPHYLDISNEDLWDPWMGKTLDRLGELVSRGIFKLVDHGSLRNLRKWACSAEVLAALGRNAGFVHNDLSGDNVFVCSNGYRIVDWQRPILGPKELDVAILLDSMDREVLRYMDQGIVWIMYLSRIAWFTESAVRWFPQGQGDYDRGIARIANLVGKA